MRKFNFVLAGLVAAALASASPALADSKALPPCTAKTPSGVACAPFFGGALKLGDPAVTDSLQGKTSGAVTNYSLAGDGTVWNVNFSYRPGDPIADTGIGFLIYDSSGGVVTLQNATGNPPHTVTWPLPSINGMTYQVQVFSYIPLKMQYTIGVTQGN